MASATEANYSRVFLFLPLTLMVELLVLSTSTTGDPTPTAWPHQFHSVLFVNRSGSLWQTDLWYDWPNGRNFNINQYQLGILKYDLEWNNGTSFIYTPFNRTCTVVHYDVGIPLPNWLDGANYLGQHYADNFLCNVWEKVDFIWYYEDVLTRRPVKWIFYDGNLVLVTGKPNLVSVSAGMTSHFMTFEVGAVLDDAHWQAPSYCFGEAADDTHNKRSSPSLDSEESRGTLMSEMGRLHAYAK